MWCVLGIHVGVGHGSILDYFGGLQYPAAPEQACKVAWERGAAELGNSEQQYTDDTGVTASSL